MILTLFFYKKLGLIGRYYPNATNGEKELRGISNLVNFGPNSPLTRTTRPAHHDFGVAQAYVHTVGSHTTLWEWVKIHQDLADGRGPVIAGNKALYYELSAYTCPAKTQTEQYLFPHNTSATYKNEMTIETQDKPFVKTLQRNWTSGYMKVIS